jgi:hypothetical protein
MHGTDISVHARFNIVRAGRLGSGPEKNEGNEWDAQHVSPGESVRALLWTSINKGMTSSKPVWVQKHTLFEGNEALEDELALRWRRCEVGVEYDHSGTSLSSDTFLTKAEGCDDIG